LNLTVMMMWCCILLLKSLLLWSNGLRFALDIVPSHYLVSMRCRGW
jgi:hypothetical protein